MFFAVEECNLPLRKARVAGVHVFQRNFVRHSNNDLLSLRDGVLVELTAASCTALRDRVQRST